MKTTSRSLIPFVVLCVVVVACLDVATRDSASSDSNSLVLYCAHDAKFAEAVIDKFRQQTGIKVDVRFDEEANKSLGLTNLLLSERQNPRCDVFWNNQTLGTIRLMSEGVLQPYVSCNAERIPEIFKDSDGHWTGFAARLRVFIVNTESMTATEERVAEFLDGESLERVAIALPQFGTTLSHYSVLCEQWGEAKLKAWHASIHERGIQQVRGNSMTRDLVAEGICDVGFTDTDDAFGAIDQQKPVAVLPVRLDNGKTICMPNSVAMIRNCPHPEPAKRLIDFLLSEEVELQLANSAARQIPLGPVAQADLSDEVYQLQEWSRDSVSLQGAADVNAAVLEWLTDLHKGKAH